MSEPDHSPEGWARVVALQADLYSGDFSPAWVAELEVAIAAAVRAYVCRLEQELATAQEVADHNLEYARGLERELAAARAALEGRG
jgi:hypothetical protein